MRLTPTHIWDVWNAGGPFIGANRPCTRVTVEEDWYLNLQSTVGTYTKGPVRWFQRQTSGGGVGDPAVETEVPNIKAVQVDRSLDADAATCNITVYNQKMKANAAATHSTEDMGNPGVMMWRDDTPEGTARWAKPREWVDILTPNALLRTYQGFGGNDVDVDVAVAAGNIVLTGVWLVDEVRAKTDATLEIRCRDMSKLLIEQKFYVPLVPATVYPDNMTWCRWITKTVTVSVQVGTGVTGSHAHHPHYGGGGNPDDPNHATSESDQWYGMNGSVHGHRPTDAFDGNPSTFWLGVGNQPQNSPWSVDYLEVLVGNNDVNAISLNPFMGNYHVYVGIMENGAWQGGGTVPYDINALRTVGGQPWSPDTGAARPYVMEFGCPWEGGARTYFLPRTFRAQKIRLSFRNLAASQWGPYIYRAGVREFRALFATSGPLYQDQLQQVTVDGNYKDYSEIIKDLLLWSGFTLYTDGVSTPEVYGNIETTGAYAEETCLFPDFFSQKPIIDIINSIKQIVGYLFWVDDEGGARFESPNWWSAGNYTMDGTFTNFIPQIDEKVNLIDYGVGFTDKPIRSDIIISSDEPTAGFTDTVTTHLTPSNIAIMRGIVKPMVWANHNFTGTDEQLKMAKLINIHMQAASQLSTVSCAANPNIQINDQVQIWERQTGETGVHYVRGINTSHDLDSGDYTMTLQTYKVGDDREWRIQL